MTPRRDRWLPWLLTGCVLSGVAAFVFLAFVVSMAFDPPAGTEAPKVTDWMQGWGSITGVLAGAAAAVAAAWLLVHERQQAREARKQLREERAEAEKTAARAVQHRSVKATVSRTENGKRLLTFSVTVANYGAEPVRGVSALLSSVERPRGYILRVGEVIGPHSELRASAKWPLPDGPEPRRSGSELQPAFVTVNFFDSAGREWVRVDNGEPARGTLDLPRNHDVFEE
ncbi:hypothetical protein O7626_15325 [Micromonospora sp. WMMD1102]|uniref:hypothetical protein n=1 Tax=Micromonospora sp. WMMD1102 TaxID=3016105 RepID=UPI00241567A1|nr:hypothetical protein [Micromonospora sp. WMMD1102]MDG4787285.1 hypothetical protein [Micromonospora sp. WMMD1102]